MLNQTSRFHNVFNTTQQFCMFIASPQWLTESGATFTHCGCVRAVTEVRYPVAALWELYKSAPLSKTMGKSCFGVQAPCPVAWSPAAPLRKPAICIHWPPALTAADKCAERRWVWSAGKNKSRNTILFMVYIWEPTWWTGLTQDDEFHPHLRAVWIVRCFCKRWVVGSREGAISPA